MTNSILIVVLAIVFVAVRKQIHAYITRTSVLTKKTILPLRIFSSVDENIMSPSNNDSDSSPENKQLTKMFELIVSSIENGREGDLVKAGLKVSKKSARETLDSKINDPQLQDMILGPANQAEELEIMQRLQSSFDDGHEQNVGGYDDIGNGQSLEMDDAIFQELKDEAYQTLEEIRKNGSGMGRLLEDEESFGTYITPEYQRSTNKVLPNNQQILTPESQLPFDPSVWGPARGAESLLSKIDHSRFPEFAENNTYFDRNSPPINSFGFAEEVSAIEEEEDGEEEGFSKLDSTDTADDSFVDRNDDEGGDGKTIRSLRFDFSKINKF
jgi:hypothetical protein